MNELNVIIKSNEFNFMGVAAYCERYEVKMEITGVYNYRDAKLNVKFTGFGEDLETLKHEYIMESPLRMTDEELERES